MTEPQNASGLMDQIHDLKRQLADAEKRGAVRALRENVTKCEGEAARIARIEGRPTAASQTWAQAAYFIGRAADLIESGQVTLR